MPVIKSIELSKEELSDLKNGKLLSRKIGKKSYCIGNAGGELFCVSDRCPHAGGKLSAGWLNDEGAIVCPVHRYKFSPSSGRSTDGNGHAVMTFKIKETEGERRRFELELPQQFSLFGFLRRRKRS